jgi:hypothetical protein
MSSPDKGGTSLLQDNLDEEQLGDLSPVITRAAVRRNTERLAAHQQAKQVSPGPSTYNGKYPERNPSPPMTRLDRLEIMIERLFGAVQVLAESRSRHSSRDSLCESPPTIPMEKHEPSEEPPVPRVAPQSQISDPVPPQVQPTVLSPTVNSAVPASTDKRDQSLEHALAKTKVNHLTRVNTQGNRFQLSMKHESTRYTSKELCYTVPPHGISDLAMPPRQSSESAEPFAE